MPEIKPKPEKKKKGKEEQRLDVRLMQPGKYEVTEDSTFPIDIFLKEAEGRFIIMDGPGEDIEHERVVMRFWGYDEMVDMRKLATAYDQKKKIHLIDQDVLNRLKVQKLMVSWTFGKDNPRLQLHHVNKTLTDESWKAWTRLHPSISTHIIDRFNAVYEHNG